jgi:predicted transcriptional regulator
VALVVLRKKQEMLERLEALGLMEDREVSASLAAAEARAKVVRMGRRWNR